MGYLETEFKRIKMEKEFTLMYLEVLKKNEYVQEFLIFQERSKRILAKEEELSLKILKETYEMCNHIWVKENEDCFGCIKCGLSQRVLLCDKNDLSSPSVLMYEYFLNHPFLLPGFMSGLSCDLELGRAIIQNILLHHKDITDEELFAYFKHALFHIQNKKVSKERILS